MIKEFASEIINYLSNLPEVNKCELYGSLANGTYDEYSDIDIMIDVSGIDNSVFSTKLPEILSKYFDVIFFDYAPSLAPEKYVLSLALRTDNPFMMVDISCVAHPHFQTVSKKDIASYNNSYDHTLKLFVANLKHHLRKTDCFNDIKKMHDRILREDDFLTEEQMLKAVYDYLKSRSHGKRKEYVKLFENYIYTLC